MSLDGNLRVFSLTEILQMLGMQRKTGILTVEGPKDTIALGFVTGRVVSVESSSNPIENRLGTLLVKAGRLSAEDLSLALETQRKGSERLGRLLLRQEMVRPEDLREAFRIQIHGILFNAFGWMDGRFRFAPQAAVDHDPELFPPLPAESILFEAARTFDELPAAEQKIPSNELVFRRVAGARSLKLTSSAAAEEGTMTVSKREAETWKWIDGRHTVGEVRQRAFLSDLDVLKGISDLLDRALIEEGYVREIAPVAATRSRFPFATLLPWLPVIVLAGASMAFMPRNRANLLFRPMRENVPVARLLRSGSSAEVSTLGRGVRVYHGSTGRYPRTLGDLVSARVVPQSALRDAYGRSYRYILRSEDGKFAIYGRTASGQIDLDLVHEGTLAPVSEIRPSAGAAPREPIIRPPGVQVVK
ncbi:MAG: DUF4388 domain-containing protein [Acidobacteriota bacterium]|nr:DUF4388 domain-containing protein [Acidobacteriota bacterium]MDQ5872053.1 DUF4388 domain-containing protein [Acidobacteriota bacterium]